MGFCFAIIGAGLTGTSMLYQLVRRLEHQQRMGGVDPHRLHIRILDSQTVAGPGFPHNGQFVDAYHITNMCADEMSVAHSLPRDFSDWIKLQKPELAMRFPALRETLCDPFYHRNGCSHYPRALMGEYLMARFQDALKTAEKLGINVTVNTDCEVTDMSDRGCRVMVQARLLKSDTALSFSADRVLLATGHWPRSGSRAGYFSSPWPAHRLSQNIPKGSDVAIIGTSLSAIEAALTLTADGNFSRNNSGSLLYSPPANARRITMLSRQGLLPCVRTKTVDYQPQYLNRKNLQQLLKKRTGNLDLETVFSLLDREFANATGGPVAWEKTLSQGTPCIELLDERIQQARGSPPNADQALLQSVLRSVLPLVRELYLALSAAERRRFEREYATLFFTHAATLPLINAEKVVALMKSNVLEVKALGEDYRLTELPNSQGFQFSYGKEASEVSIFRYVVDARGQERSVLRHPSPLVQNMIQSRMVYLGDAPDKPESTKLTSPPVRETGEEASESIRIDPDTHRIMQISSLGTPRKSKVLFAVGAMTRGQIIDVSMARALTRSTDSVAKQIVEWLINNPTDSAAESKSSTTSE